MSGNQRNGNRRDKVWVSHNRVLVGGGNKKNMRNPNFDTEETKLLISLWGNPAIQKTLITSHKKFPIITKLSETMRQYGYQRTPEEINTRLKNLKCLYNRLKKDVECGLRVQPTWKHYTAMDAILTRPIFGYQNSGEAQDDEDEDPGQLMVKDELDMEMDDDDELRPEDLLQVEEDNYMPDEDDVVIKEEPIDVDEYDKKNESSKPDSNSPESRNVNMEKLPKLIPRSSWLNNSSSNGPMTNSSPASRESHPPPPLQNSQKMATRQNSVICVSAPRSLAPVTPSSPTIAAPSVSLSAQSKAKISLVPTNLLLNQQKPAGKNFFVSKSMTPMTPTTVTQSVVDANKSKMPMKVLLVNTMPKAAQMTSGGVSVSTTTANNKAEVIPKVTVTSTAGISKPSFPTPKIRRTEIPRRRPPASLAIPGMKSLLSSLIRTQQEANALNRQRLLLDTEKFNFERKAIEDILGLVPILKQIGTQFLRPETIPQEIHTQRDSSPPKSVPQCNGHNPRPSQEEEEDEDGDDDEEGEVSIVEQVEVSDT